MIDEFSKMIECSAGGSEYSGMYIMGHYIVISVHILSVQSINRNVTYW